MIIHLVGAQRTNYPWGFENRLIPAIKELGHTLISTDYRQERPHLQKLLTQKADLILVCKGEGIKPDLLEACPAVTAVWYAEQLGTPFSHDETSLARRKELAFNLPAFDYAFSHDPANLLIYKRLGAQRVSPLPCAAVDPALNRKLDIPKKYDVVFVGSKTPRRKKLLEDLAQKGIAVYTPDIWDAEELNNLFNESRIVLNLHLSDLLNTETRVAEVLGAGSFLLTEPLSDRDLVQPGKHFAEFASGDMEELAGKIRYYLAHEKERETIALDGYRFIHQNHTYAKRIQTILDAVDFSLNRRIWPSYSLGIPLNTRLQPTLRLERYNTMVKESLKTELKLTDAFVYSQQWYDTEYHLERLGLDVRTFDEIRTQYENNSYRKRLQAILDFAKIDQGPLNWLEVGCHVGMTAYWAACRYPQAHFYMFDFSKTSIDWLHREFPFPKRATIWQTSVENIRLPDDSLDSRMDVVTCMDVTQHLPDPVYRKMIDELKRVMKPSGLLILLQGTAPNEEHIHILQEEQIDADFLAAGFEKTPSLHPTVHLFRKPCDESLSEGDIKSHNHSVSSSTPVNGQQKENSQSLKNSREQNDTGHLVKRIDARPIPNIQGPNASTLQNSASANDIGLTLEEYPSTGKRSRNLRILAAFAHFNWEDHNLQPALEEFGEVIRLRWPPYNQYEDNWHFSKKQWFNIRLLEAIEKAHAAKPIDVFFGYVSGRLVFPSTIRTIGRMGIPTLSMSLDDRTKFRSRLEPTGYAGMIDIAGAFSLCWTSTEDAVKQYESVGARAIYLPEGANPLVYRPLNIPFDMDVSFVGQCYGQRAKIIEQLKNKGINVQTFGKGWPSGELTVEEMVQIYNRSRINIGFSMVGDHEDVFCLKGRDFEIPISGGLYLTQFHPELGNVYDIGKEIICYQGLDDMVAKIRHYLERPEEAEEIRKAGYQRAVKEHTWVQRFRRAFEAMGLLK